MVTDNGVKNTICPGAATIVAAEEFVGDPAAIKQAKKDYTPRCVAHFKTVRATPVASRELVDSEVLTTAWPRQKDAQDALLEKAASVLRRVLGGTTTPPPRVPPPTDVHAVGQGISKGAQDLFDGDHVFAYALGATVKPLDVPPTVAENNFAVLSYDHTNNSTFKSADHITAVVTFLTGVQSQITTAWVTAAQEKMDTSKPLAPDNAKNPEAYKALQRLQVFFYRVTNHPPAIRAAIAPIQDYIPTLAATPTPEPRTPEPRTPAATTSATIRVRAGGAMTLSASCLNATDSQATESLRSRCIVPGTQQNALGVGGNVNVGIDIRLTDWQGGGLYFSIDGDLTVFPRFNGLQLDEDLAEITKQDVREQTPGTFNPRTWTLSPGVMALFAGEHVGVRGSLGLGLTFFNGNLGTIDTGAADVVNGGAPTAAQIFLDPAFALMPRLELFAGHHWGLFGFEVFASVSRIFHPNQSGEVTLPGFNRPETVESGLTPWNLGGRAVLRF